MFQYASKDTYELLYAASVCQLWTLYALYFLEVLPERVDLHTLFLFTCSTNKSQQPDMQF
jgi:hypothetical protein